MSLPFYELPSYGFQKWCGHGIHLVCGCRPAEVDDGYVGRHRPEREHDPFAATLDRLMANALKE